MVSTEGFTRIEYRFAEDGLENYAAGGLTRNQISDLCAACGEALAKAYPKADILVTAEARFRTQARAWIGDEEVDEDGLDLHWIIDDMLTPVIVKWAEGLPEGGNRASA